MDGKDALRRLRELLDEESTGTWLDDRTSYDYLWESAKEFVRRTNYQTSVQRIQTSKDVNEYMLNADFMGLYQKEPSQDRYFIKVYSPDGENRIYFKDYEDIAYNKTEVVDVSRGTLSFLQSNTQFRDTGQDFTDYDIALNSSSDVAYKISIYQNDGSLVWAYLGECPDTTNSTDYIYLYDNSDMKTKGIASGTVGTPSYYTIERISAQQNPSHFTIRPRETLNSQITGTATKTKTASAGEVRLEDSSALFYTTDYVSPGDHIHNTSDSGTGIVLQVESATQLKIALFGGTDNNVATTDAYVIQPMGRSSLIIEPASNTAGLIMEVPYVKMPDPVYADYRTYNFPQPVMEAIIKYAAWMYKYRDGEPQFGDALYVMWDKACREFYRGYQPILRRRKFHVSMKAR